MNQIEVRNITKDYGNTVALDNVSLTLEPGKIYGLLGRNGAGKSTLLNLITSRIFPTEGDILIEGQPARENDITQSKIYCMSEQNLYPESMKVKEAMKWTKVFYPDTDVEYANTLAAKFSLSLNKKIKALSTGYQSIFKVIIALSCNAPILLLDEPVLGLDANYRDLFYKELLKNYTEHPRTIVISTHLIEEAANIIENVIIIKEGKIIMNTSAEDALRAGYTVTGSAQRVNEYVRGKNVLGEDTLGGMKSAYVLGEMEDDAYGLEISHMKLQTLFIHLTNS